MRSWQATTALFLTTMMLQGLAYGHINAYLPLYLQELGLSDAEVSTWPGILYAVMMGVAFPFAPFGVGLALGIGALAYAAGGLTGWLAERATPAEIARLRLRTEAEARPAGTAAGA